ISGPILAGLVVAATFWYVAHSHPGEHRIVVSDQSVYVSIADTEAAREQGLGGRASLAPDEGMLFVFPIEGQYPFWMKDMKFPIDIVWIETDGTVFYIKDSVDPDTYPDTFAPDAAIARYVLELPAGYASAHNLQVGDQTQLNLAQ